MFGSCCVPFSKKREMETRSDCARRRRVGLAADTQFVVKLSGDCRRKWLDIRFVVAAVRCTSKRERFVAAVVDLVNSHTLAKGYGSRWCLLQYRTYSNKRRGHLISTPIPYMHDWEMYSHISSDSFSNIVYSYSKSIQKHNFTEWRKRRITNVFSNWISLLSYGGIFPLRTNR